ncbi:MAG: hypothetical protein QXM31_03485 [Candidatus Woesearchaeota archaeon]
MELDSVFITDMQSIKAFIQMQKKEEDYFNHVMDKVMSRKKA